MFKKSGNGRITRQCISGVYLFIYLKYCIYIYILNVLSDNKFSSLKRPPRVKTGQILKSWMVIPIFIAVLDYTGIITQNLCLTFFSDPHSSLCNRAFLTELNVWFFPFGFWQREIWFIRAFVLKVAVKIMLLENHQCMLFKCRFIFFLWKLIERY